MHEFNATPGMHQRMMKSLVITTAYALAFAACQSPGQQSTTEPGAWPQGTIVDLTHSFDGSTIYWPTEAGFILHEGGKGWQEAGYYYEANSFEAAEHGGTHLDAPVHFSEGQWSTDEVPLDRLMGPAVVVDVSAKALEFPDYQVSVQDFMDWEAANGTLPGGSIVIIRTGYFQLWPNRAEYLGTDLRGPEAIPALHFPGLHPEAARWLASERSIHAIGLDTPSIDYGQSSLFEAHQALFAANIPVFENVANLGNLPETGFDVIALPMKIGGGSGGPLRIVAIVR